jgi:Holliday junction resolvase RusA-like endonuclease
MNTFSFTWHGRACGVNKRYVNRSYALSTEYRRFIAGIMLACRIQNPCVKATGDIELDIQLAVSPSRDSDSLIKPLFDGIERSGVIANDRQIKRYSVTVCAKKRGEDDEVRVEGREIIRGEL